MLIREKMIASKIVAKLREKYPQIEVEVNYYANVKLVIMFRTISNAPHMTEVILECLDLYTDESDMIEDAVILVKRNIKEY